MTDTQSDSAPSKMLFLKGGEDVVAQIPFDVEANGKLSQAVRTQLSDAINARHVSFLFGSGCSSFRQNGEELGIPTMGPLAAEYQRTIGDILAEDAISEDDYDSLLRETKLDIRGDAYSANLERLMEILYSLRFVLSNMGEGSSEALRLVNSTISNIKTFVLRKCSKGRFNTDDSVLAIYQEFFRKLVYRDRSLDPPWIFTTNYDLFCETAMDRLGIPYFNGFTGVVERRFNPASYRHSLASQMDLAERRWSAADGFVYLAKLHGSITWFEDGVGLFPIREQQGIATDDANKILIYPTPAKQNASLGAPYSDLFRQFQQKVIRAQSVLVVCGYSFGDEHINNIIFQGLTIPTFRLIIFADPETTGNIQTLRALQDPRIWIIGGAGPMVGQQAHYFSTIVKNFLPTLPGEKVDEAISKALAALVSPQGQRGDGEALDDL